MSEKMTNAEREERAAAEKSRLNAVVNRLCDFVAENRVAVHKEIVDRLAEEDVTAQQWPMPEAEKGRDEGLRALMDDPLRHLARELYKKLPEEMRIDVMLVEGHAITELHGWFAVKGNPTIIEDPQWTYLVDPATRGLLLLSTHLHQLGDIAIVTPWCPLHQSYIGRVVRDPWE